jgi:two-component system sensor histidine kinase ComP
VNQLVRIGVQDGILELLVSDDGPGFDCSEASNWDSHLGLAGMRERVESLGGQFYTESQPGKGVKVFARLVLKVEEGADG